MLCQNKNTVTACLAIAFSCSVSAKPVIRQFSEEEIAADRQAQLSNTPLELDYSCTPGLIRRSYLVAAPSKASRFFWVGQRYAVAREVQNQLNARRAGIISDRADTEIAAIEDRRDAALGIPTVIMDPKLHRALNESRQAMVKVNNEILSGVSEWAARCNKVIDENLRKEIEQ